MDVQLIQVAPNGSGPQVLGIKGVAYVNGVATDVHIQGVALIDSAGNPVEIGSQPELLRLLLMEARLQTEISLRILAAIDQRAALSRQELIEAIAEGDQPEMENAA